MLLHQQATETLLCAGIAGIQAGRGLEFNEGLVVLVELVVRGSEIGMSGVRAGLLFGCGLEERQRSFEFLLVYVEQTK